MLDITMDFYPIIQNNHAIGLINKNDKTEYYFVKSMRRKARHMIKFVKYRGKSYRIGFLNKFYLLFKHKNIISKMSIDNMIYYITDKSW